MKKVWNKLGRRAKVLAVVGVLALVACGVGFAAWLITSNNGTGYGKIGSLAAPVINTQATPTYGSVCLAGGTCDLTVKVDNSNSTALVPTSIAAGLGSADSSSDSINCPISNMTLNTSGVTFSPTSIPANSTGTILTLQGAVSLASSAPSACQGVTFTKGVKVSFTTP